MIFVNFFGLYSRHHQYDRKDFMPHEKHTNCFVILNGTLKTIDKLKSDTKGKSSLTAVIRAEGKQYPATDFSVIFINDAAHQIHAMGSKNTRLVAEGFLLKKSGSYEIICEKMTFLRNFEPNTTQESITALEHDMIFKNLPGKTAS